MSSREDSSGPEGEAFRSLEAAVDRALDEIARLRRGLEAAEARQEQLSDLLRSFQEGTRDPVRMARRLDALEAENADLHDRVTQGREGVERLLSRIRFLEDQR